MKARRLIEDEGDDKDEVLLGHLAAKSYTQVGGDFGDPWLYGGAWLSGDGQVVVYMRGAEDEIGYPRVQPAYRFHVEPELDSWVDEAGIKETAGISDEEWSEMPMYAKWLAVGQYYGFAELDSYPHSYTKASLSKMLGVDL